MWAGCLSFCKGHRHSTAEDFSRALWVMSVFSVETKDKFLWDLRGHGTNSLLKCILSCRQSALLNIDLYKP